MTGIYIHVPFCAVKCPYCDFYSCGYTMNKAKEYKNAVLRNIDALPQITADTVYFGGGTPSILPAEFISEMIAALKNKVKLVSPEITIEVNPCTITQKKLNEYRKAGINRLSVGVQSGNDEELEFLGRKHTFEKAKQVVISAYNEGFENISCDLMIGTKGQTVDKLICSIEKITNLPITHVSSYILKVEENTVFGKNNIESLLPDSDETADLYLCATKHLKNAGFEQYEISNYARRGFESRHNLKYWKCEDYIGIGPGAYACFNGRRYYVLQNLEMFCENNLQTEINEEYISCTDEEKIMLGLRLSKGICINDYPDYKETILKKSYKYTENELAVLENNVLKLTAKGFLVSNSIIADILYQ